MAKLKTQQAWHVSKIGSTSVRGATVGADWLDDGSQLKTTQQLSLENPRWFNTIFVTLHIYFYGERKWRAIKKMKKKKK